MRYYLDGMKQESGYNGMVVGFNPNSKVQIKNPQPLVMFFCFSGSMKYST